VSQGNTGDEKIATWPRLVDFLNDTNSTTCTTASMLTGWHERSSAVE